MDLEGKKVLVFGSGISGIGAADLLEQVHAVPIIYDGNEQKTEQEIKANLVDGANTSVILGNLPDAVIMTLDLVVLSPGVPTDLPVMDKFRERKIPIWGEVELAYRMGRGRVCAITGTNGKTTTTALTGKIMKDYYDSVYIVGNIGTPYTSAALAMTDETVTVAEVSSFQLETIDQFAPEVSAILNISEDHLNRHHTMEEYIRVKELVTKNQKATDVTVLNYEDEVLRSFGQQVHTKVVYFSSQTKLLEGIYLDGEQIVLRDGGQEIVVTTISKLKVLGRHNHENVMAAVAIGYYAGVPMASICKSIERFQAVEHRIEYVAEKQGVVYYNDSKGTNPDAAVKGIQAMNRPTLLIGGGYDKQADYQAWIRSFEGKVRHLILIGETREKIAAEAHRNGFMDTIFADSLEEAVAICTKRANPGDAVLLSPACASWGQFDNYEQRGDMFKQYVLAIE